MTQDIMRAFWGGVEWEEMMRIFDLTDAQLTAIIVAH